MMEIKAVKFRKDGFYSQPFAFGGEEGMEKFDKNVRYRGSLQNYLISHSFTIFPCTSDKLGLQTQTMTNNAAASFLHNPSRRAGQKRCHPKKPRKNLGFLHVRGPKKYNVVL